MRFVCGRGFGLDWILPVDGDQLRAKCKYCNRVLNARYLQLLRHSLSNKHLCNAAAAVIVSLPVDVDSCPTVEQSEAVEADSQLMTEVEPEDDDMLAAAVDQLYPADPTTAVSFVADSDSTGISIDRLKQVGFDAFCVSLCHFLANTSMVNCILQLLSSALLSAS